MTGSAEEERRLSVAELKDSPATGASDMAHIVLTFDNNKLASALYGQFDENLARLEQKLGVAATTGNWRPITTLATLNAALADGE